jgi:hypothetical protein
VVLDREPDQEKSPSGPRIRCPLCGYSPRKHDRWSCSCGHQWNTLIREECARHASTTGLQPSASLATAGRRTLTGIRSDLPILAFAGKAALALNPKPAFGFTSAANPELLPEPEPRAMREHFVVPAIGSRDVACAEWPNIRRLEHFL